MRQARRQNVFNGYLVGEQNVEISLLRFADDTLFFANNSMQNVLTIKAILRFFELASGLKVNFFKSKVVGIGVDEASMRRYVKVLDCKIT